MPMKSVSAILTIVVLLSLTLACHAGNADPAAVHAKIKAGAMVVDVRTPAEFASGAYQGAINTTGMSGIVTVEWIGTGACAFVHKYSFVVVAP